MIDDGGWPWGMSACDGCGKAQYNLAYKDIPPGWICVTREADGNNRRWYFHSWPCLRRTLARTKIGPPKTKTMEAGKIILDRLGPPR